MSPGWEQPPSHPPSSLSFSLPHGSEIIHPPTDRCCVGGRCQGARSVWCKRVCVPALCLHVSICAHERLSVHLRACTCRSRVSRAASFRLDADMSVWLFDEFTCICPPANIFPLPSLQGNNTVILSDWPCDYHLLFSSARLFSLYPLFPSSISLALPLFGVRAQTEREKKLAVRHIPLLPSLCLHLSSLLPYNALSSPSRPPSFLSPPRYFPHVLLAFLSPPFPLCLVAPLIHYISTPLLLPPLTPPPYFFSGS